MKNRLLYVLAMYGPSVFWVTAFWVYNTYLYPGVIQ